MARRFPFPLPNGWFAVAWSEALAPGDVRAVHCLDRELVVFRTESGEARVFDAYCPHLGAHLGHGGTVVGETLRCPFHAWRYDGSGRCIEIPYAKKIPSKARVSSWRVLERYGLIFVWHHLEDKEPFYPVPDLPEFEDAGWLTVKHHEFEVRTAIQEMAENDHDSAHFAYVHESDYLKTEISYDGLTKKAVSLSNWEIVPGEPMETVLERTNYGLGLATVRTLGIPDVGLSFLSAVTPIDHDRVIARWIFRVSKNIADSYGTAFAEGMTMGVQQDIPVWENKIYQPRPVLCDGDGPIAEFRKWAQNFYSKEPIE